MVKVAIPVDVNCLSTHFGECSQYALFTVEHSKVIEKVLIQPNISDREQFVTWFKSMNVTDVITYKIHKEIIHSFIKNKINVFVGTNQLPPELLIQDYINGKLLSNLSVLE